MLIAFFRELVPKKESVNQKCPSAYHIFPFVEVAYFADNVAIVTSHLNAWDTLFPRIRALGAYFKYKLNYMFSLQLQ